MSDLNPDRVALIVPEPLLVVFLLSPGKGSNLSFCFPAVLFLISALRFAAVLSLRPLVYFGGTFCAMIISLAWAFLALAFSLTLYDMPSVNSLTYMLLTGYHVLT